MNSIINRNLLKAVNEGNLNEVKAILANGGDINAKTNMFQDTLLHLANTVEVAKELLSRGINVNSKNDVGWTPLHSAVRLGKDIEVIRLLLNNSADVNAKDDAGITPLFIDVYYSFSDKRMEITTELLHFGADIDLTSCNYHYCSVLDIAVEKTNILCAKILIKFTILKKYDSGCKQIINLDGYGRRIRYNLSRYVDECFIEIAEMKRDVLSSFQSLYQLVITKTDFIKPLYYKNEEEISLNYPIYQDIILPKIKPGLERGRLLNTLKRFQIISKPSTSDQVFDAILLNTDCIYKIATYLCNNDLLNMVKAADRYYGKESINDLTIEEENSILDGSLDVLADVCVKRLKTMP